MIIHANTILTTSFPVNLTFLLHLFWICASPHKKMHWLRWYLSCPWNCYTLSFLDIPNGFHLLLSSYPVTTSSFLMTPLNRFFPSYISLSTHIAERLYLFQFYVSNFISHVWLPYTKDEIWHVLSATPADEIWLCLILIHVFYYKSFESKCSVPVCSSEWLHQ